MFLLLTKCWLISPVRLTSAFWRSGYCYETNIFISSFITFCQRHIFEFITWKILIILKNEVGFYQLMNKYCWKIHDLETYEFQSKNNKSPYPFLKSYLMCFTSSKTSGQKNIAITWPAICIRAFKLAHSTNVAHFKNAIYFAQHLKNF